MRRMRWLSAALLAAAPVVMAGCTAQGAESPVDALQSENRALRQQLAAMAPTTVIQAGQLAPPPPAAQATGWDTPESIRGKIRLLATYDSSGPDAWSAAEHPLVYVTSEGV